ncbi:hypothetical protein GPECTOR_4g545 [Gonium pectorale]|uniref:BTB domain-containing protein n=1 Tax=Gonium pectorale TaxID=33097 RepID=A0A150GYS4_GONPE|nr:hypothetical protein GPECTOR_4g545 [Gonium pectorale]|eukprot:KXZ54480.1 hypothetical protein GPECTOR_4g545 [Gonium pectorale]
MHLTQTLRPSGTCPTHSPGSTYTIEPNLTFGCKGVLPHSSLAPDSGYLREAGTLVIRAEVQVEDPQKWSVGGANGLSSDTPPLHDLPGATSDFTLLAGGRSFPVLRAIIAARSPFFKTLFNNGLSGSVPDTLLLQDAHPDALALLLRIVDGDAPTCPPEQLKPIAELANVFLLAEARDALYGRIGAASSAATVVTDLL